MATLQDFRDERLRKLAELKELGVDPYPADSHRTHNAGDIVAKFEELEGQTATVAGRVTGIRKFGKLAFIVLKDFSGQIQLFLHAPDVAQLDAPKGILGMDQLVLLDTGDFIEATGDVVRTKTGEISIGVKTLRLLTKAIRPMPTELTDKEQRLRRRYVDMNVNTDVRDRFVRRSRFWQATREFMMGENFLEINIPVLEGTPGGADANPFITHMDALDQDFYLRISHELPLKRLLVGGYEKVFDIGARFRNENYSEEHLPEHVAMEWYWAYADWEKGMELTERMIRFIVDKTWGTRKFTLADGAEVDFGNDGEHFPRISFVDVLKDQYEIDVFNSSIEDIAAALKQHGLEVEKQDNRQRSLDKLWKKYRKTVAGPVFLVDMPTFMQPLAKVQEGNPELTEQFNLVFGGSEMCKAFSELNDPVDQFNRFMEQQAMRDAGDDEAQMLDIDYVEALEYAMPPACGLGFSERIFWSLEGVTAREGVVFPQLRYEVDGTTKAIYPGIHTERSTFSPTVAKQQIDKPLSAVEEGTKKLYLDNFSLRECDATVQLAERQEGDTVTLILDQTCLYPGGGGQAHDLGEISWQSGKLHITEVSKDKEGVVRHSGELEGDMPAIGDSVRCIVEPERRLLNSRLHCVGHILDYAVALSGKKWKAGKGAHYPHMSFVDYDGEFDATEAENLRQKIEEEINNFIRRGGQVGVKRVLSQEAHEHSNYIPQAMLDKYQYVHLATYPENFNVCCGGTHVQDLSKIGKVIVTRVKRKDGHNRVSYTLDDLPQKA